MTKCMIKDCENEREVDKNFCHSCSDSIFKTIVVDSAASSIIKRLQETIIDLELSGQKHLIINFRIKKKLEPITISPKSWAYALGDSIEIISEEESNKTKPLHIILDKHFIEKVITFQKKRNGGVCGGNSSHD